MLENLKGRGRSRILLLLKPWRVGRHTGFLAEMDGLMPGALGILLQVTSARAAIPEFQNPRGGFPFLSPHSSSKDFISSNPSMKSFLLETLEVFAISLTKPRLIHLLYIRLLHIVIIPICFIPSTVLSFSYKVLIKSTNNAV